MGCFIDCRMEGFQMLGEEEMEVTAKVLNRKQKG
jgi:hypothetical protein